MFDLFKKKRNRNNDCIDGGVKKYDSGVDAPKTIESENIVEFYCKISFIGHCFEEQSELDGRVYEFKAELQGNEAKCSAQWYDRVGGRGKAEYTRDRSFLADLQEIVKKYDLVRHNGYVSTVSGLPYFYGAMLDIRYDSDESIYAKDNQSCFISKEVARELIRVFKL